MYFSSQTLDDDDLIEILHCADGHESVHGFQVRYRW